MTVSIQAAQMQAALEKMGQNAVQSPDVSAQLASKFQSMMEKPSMASPAQPSQDGTAVAQKLVASQDAELQQTVNDALSLAQQAPTLSMNEMSAGTIRMTLELASTQLDLEAKMGVVDSSKSAIETLMKNQ